MNNSIESIQGLILEDGLNSYESNLLFLIEKTYSNLEDE
jgi:hypothetical protein